MGLKEYHGFYFPSYDDHFPKMLDKSLKKDNVLRYQWRARDAAVNACTKKRICIDIGANVGLWACDLVKSFKHVHAFEPVRDFRKCFVKNVKLNNYTLYENALGKEETSINMNIVTGNTGHSHVDPSSYGKGQIAMKTLDSFNFENIDLIKIDVEGFEEQILLGSQQTIERNLPILVIEQQKHEYQNDMKDLTSIKLLNKWGYEVIDQYNKDWILKSKKA
jgi:FkbM family methyltransferase